MSENYFYSSLSGQEIEDTLVGAVRFNTDQQLTTSQKALARQNIGAGEANTQIKIKGFYDTLSDLQQAIPVGNEGDVYAVGTESPYDLYIWNAVNNVWVNNGPISFSDAIIDDNDISTSSTWSSAKTSGELAGKQNTLTFDGSPVEDSQNPVTSGGVFTALAGVTEYSSGKFYTRLDGGGGNDYSSMVCYGDLVILSIDLQNNFGSASGWKNFLQLDSDYLPRNGIGGVGRIRKDGTFIPISAILTGGGIVRLSLQSGNYENLQALIVYVKQ